VLECWHRFDESYILDEKYAGAATSYGVDSNWYTDTGATNHVTGELEKLTVHDRYRGNDQIHTANGAGMNICRIGHSIVKTPHHNLMLKNVIYTPDATKNLVSVHKLAADNYAFLEYHLDFFIIRDRATRRLLLKGRCHNCLYPLLLKSLKKSSKLAFGVYNLSLERWHSRLSYASIPVVERIVSSFSLPCASEPNKYSVCDAYQRAKSCQLPYPKSNSSSSYPLELIYSDVWGYALKSASAKQYYVSFIDDFSNISWIYPLKFKSEVFQKFVEFQNLMEHLFDSKIITVQMDRGGEYY
jgi:hypothetical protein